MKKIYLLFTIFISLACCDVCAQDVPSLLKQAIAQSGKDAIYLRDFSVCFEAAKEGETAPKGKFPILLSKNTTYRFNVASDDMQQSQAIMDLYLDGELVMSNYNKEDSSYKRQLEITPKKAATYYLQFSFVNGNAGCAAAVVAKIGNESSKTINQQLDVLYAQADNPLFFEQGKNSDLQVATDNGYVIKVSSTDYIVHPNEDGSALLTVHLIGNNNEVKEIVHKQYLVLSLTKPYVSLGKIKDGKITKKALLESSKIELRLTDQAKSNYKVLSFTLSDSDNLISGLVNTSNRFSKQQKNWIEELKPGTSVYIKNVQAKSPDNQIINLSPLEFIVE